MASGVAALTLGSLAAQAQTSPETSPPPAQKIQVTEPNGDVEVTAPTGEVRVTTPTQDVQVNTPTQAPLIVEPAPAVPAPVVVEEHPVNLTVVAPERPRNMTISLGGGISNFTDNTMQSRTGMQGAYEARLGFGASSFIGLEAAYVGTAGSIDTLGLDDDAVLVSNGAEALGRVNLTRNRVQPFLVGGASWVRYNITNASVNTSDVRNSDDVMAVPFGGGVSAYVGNGLVLDGRFIYRAMFDDELIKPTTGNSDGSKLNNWVASLRLGYAF